MNKTMLKQWVLVFIFLGAGASGVLASPAGGDLEEFLADTPESGWSELTIDTTRDVGTHLDVAVLPGTGAPYVSYYDKSGADLWFARFVGSGGNCGPGNSWSCQLVGSTGDIGKYNSIAVRDTGTTIQVIITYLTGPSLGYAWGECSAGGCTFTPYLIETGTPAVVTRGLYTSVEFGSNGYPYIAYQTLTNTNSGYARIATRTFGSGNCGVGAVAGLWQCDTILNAPGLGSYTSVALNASGALNVAFYDPINGRPHHAVRVGSGGNCGPSNSWYCRSPFINSHDTGLSTSLFVESDGTPHLAYVDATTQALVYASYVGSDGTCGFSSISLQFEWWCSVIDPEIGNVGTGRTVALAGDSAGNPMIAYRDASSTVGPAVLKFAKFWTDEQTWMLNCGPWSTLLGAYTWSCTTIDGGGAYQDEAASVAISYESDAVAVAYHEEDTYAYPEEGNLKINLKHIPFFADGFETGDLSRWSFVTIP
jgi:hypothetical protein